MLYRISGIIYISLRVATVKLPHSPGQHRRQTKDSPARLMFGFRTLGTFAVSIDYEGATVQQDAVKNVPQYNYFSEEDTKRRSSKA